MKSKGFHILSTALVALILLAGCASDLSSTADGPGEPYTTLVLSVGIPSTASNADSRGDFDNFDNEADKWGAEGENISELRIIIIGGDGLVECNRRIPGIKNADKTGPYEFRVKRNDTKTVVLVANETGYSVDTQGMEIGENTQLLTTVLESLSIGTPVDIDVLRGLTLPLATNSPDKDAASLRSPILITEIYEEVKIGDVTTYEADYAIRRAAVKYSFRIINRSKFPHTLEALRIDRIANREYLFPHATYKNNDLGHQVIDSYETPSGSIAEETAYQTTLSKPLKLSKEMKEAVKACDPIYVPEGFKADAAQQVSLTLDGAPLEIWRDLEWLMPGETEATPRPMVDLPRNTHVVINITIRDDNTYEAVADVQPYAEVVVKPPYGLDRDENGNIVLKRYEDGTYDVLDNGKTVTYDKDGDVVVKKFKDGTFLCVEKVYKDYIHGSSEVDYEYEFEKDIDGNMIVIRQISTGGLLHGDVEHHEHDEDDRPLFVLDKKGDFHMVSYDTQNNPSYSDTDIFRGDGAEIIQANGYQFRKADDMARYIGSYIVRKTDGTEELRYYKDGRTLDWEEGVPEKLRIH